jgi:hypothetical protein
LKKLLTVLANLDIEREVQVFQQARIDGTLAPKGSLTHRQQRCGEQSVNQHGQTVEEMATLASSEAIMGVSDMGLSKYITLTTRM